MIKLILRFFKELYRWIIGGAKYRSPEEMLEIYDICKQCPFFKRGGGHVDGYDKCTMCGCNLHPTSKKINKIAWATTKCPLPKPRWGGDEGK